MKKTVSLILLMLGLGTLLLGLETEEQQPSYQEELQHFYFDRGEYDLAILAYQSIDVELNEAARLLFARSLLELDSLESALIEITNLKHKTENDSLRALYLNMIKDNIEDLEPLNKIDLLTRIFEQTVSLEPDLDLFLIVAETYEQLKLYSEANDIYRNIIRYNYKLNSSDYKLKIALNQIHKKDYNSALMELKPIITSEDSIYIEDALFYDYIAHYALDDYQAASHSLLKLYYNYPENDRQREVIAQLSNIYFAEKQYILSWYWLEQLYEISGRGEQSIILQKIKGIKLGLAESKNNLDDQFKYFKPIFEMELVIPTVADSLKTKGKEILILE